MSLHDVLRHCWYHDKNCCYSSESRFHLAIHHEQINNCIITVTLDYMPIPRNLGCRY